MPIFRISGEPRHGSIHNLLTHSSKSEHLSIK